MAPSASAPSRPSAPAASPPEPSIRAAATPASTPAPCRNVRRDRCFLVMNPSSSISAAGPDTADRTPLTSSRVIWNGVALDDAEHERREPVVVLRRRGGRSRAPPACRSTAPAGRARRSAASRSPWSRTRRTGVSSACRRSAGPLQRRAVGELARRVDRRPAVALAPVADQIEVLEREARSDP